MPASDTNSLTCTVRTEFGKGAARRTRRAGLIPAVLYGHGEAPVHLTLPGHETFLALKDNANALLTLEFDGGTELALSKDVQRDPVRRTIDHVDLVLVRRGEKVSVEIPVHIEGESAPATIHTLELQTLQVLAEATHIPEYVTVNIDGLEDGHTVRAEDVTLPDGVELETEGEYTVVNISIPRISEEDLEPDTEIAEGEAGQVPSSDEPAEPESEDDADTPAED